MALELGKPKFIPRMDPNLNDFTEGNAFWIFLTDNGVPVASTAVRHERVGNESVTSFWKRTFRRHYPNADDQTIISVAQPAAARLRGNLIYVGELFVSENSRGSRDTLRLFMMLAHLSVMVRWPVDWCYAFMRDRDVKLGFAARYGFTWQLPCAQVWANAPEGRSSSEWLVAVTREDLEHMFQAYAISPDSL